MQEKLFIQNRKGQKISVLVEKLESPKGLVFVMHGLGGFKEQSHIETYTQAFLENGYIAVRFARISSSGTPRTFD